VCSNYSRRKATNASGAGTAGRNRLPAVARSRKPSEAEATAVVGGRILHDSVGLRSSHRSWIVEHYKATNPIVILTHALNQPSRKLMMQTAELSGTALAHEISALDSEALTYLSSKRVFDVPPTPTW
jgi:hypothetical protein